MRQARKIGYFLVIATLLAACGTSRKARRDYAPDATHAALDKGVPVKENVGKDLGPLPPSITVRIDSLLLAADTLLQRTQLGLHIVDLHTGAVLYARNEQQRMRPASTEKVVTAIAALDRLGPSYLLSTRLLTTANISGGTLQGDLYVQGVMDPLLATADVQALAAQLKSAGIRRIAGRLMADASFKDADEYGWGWCWDDDNPTLSPLLVGGKPDLMAALRKALSKAGITIAKGTATGTTPASARCLATLQRPLTDVLQPMMKESDNLCAEAVFYQLKQAPSSSPNGKERLAQGKHYSRNIVAKVVRDVIERAYALQSFPSIKGEAGGESSVVADGSGLSLYNYQTPETFTRLLAYAAARPDSIFNPLLAALPIAAVDGTLRKRMAGTPAAANVRAKTGSVTAVSTLVGYTTQRSTGHLIAFAIMNQGVQRMADGRALQDKICILLSE